MVDFVLVLIELFLLDVTAEALRKKKKLKIGVLQGGGRASAKFLLVYKRTSRTNHLYTENRPMNDLQFCS